MTIKRIVPNIRSENFEKSRSFYTGFLGLDVAMDMEWVLMFASPSNPTAQLTLLEPSEQELHPDISIEVDDVDAVHAKATEQGRRVVYPLTDEPWGVRRFFVEDPNGVVINVLSHLE